MELGLPFFLGAPGKLTLVWIYRIDGPSTLLFIAHKRTLPWTHHQNFCGFLCLHMPLSCMFHVVTRSLVSSWRIEGRFTGSLVPVPGSLRSIRVISAVKESMEVFLGFNRKKRKEKQIKNIKAEGRHANVNSQEAIDHLATFCRVERRFHSWESDRQLFLESWVSLHHPSFSSLGPFRTKKV